ncbi:1405_t:CDS:2 [Entrophospora sp. SA101]|nr:1405_t:CDS:2 [Entrophospora sp. SA101]
MSDINDSKAFLNKYCYKDSSLVNCRFLGLILLNLVGDRNRIIDSKKSSV